MMSVIFQCIFLSLLIEVSDLNSKVACGAESHAQRLTSNMWQV